MCKGKNRDPRNECNCTVNFVEKIFILEDRSTWDCLECVEGFNLNLNKS
jgi:hypothetical protein